MPPKREIPSFLIPGAEQLYRGDEARVHRPEPLQGETQFFNALGEIVTELRTEHELTQREAAKVLGMAPKSLRHAEQGGASSLTTLARVAEGYDVTLEEMLVEASGRSVRAPEGIIVSARDAIGSAIVEQSGYQAPASFQSSLADFLEEQRRQQDLSIRDVSDRAGVAHATYRHASSGEYPDQRIDVVYRVAGGFEGISPEELITRASARSAGIDLSDPSSNDPREWDVALLLSDIRRRAR